MLRRILILDAVLVVLLVFGAMKIRRAWKAFGPMHDVASIQPRSHTYPPISTSGAAGVAAISDWTDIPSRNPFSFDRNDVDIIVAVPVEAPPPKPLGPKPILFGTIFVGDERTAFVARGPSGNRNSLPMKVGEAVDGWTIVEIGTKSIQIESNGIRQTIITNDPTTAPPRQIVRNAAAPPAPAAVQDVAAPAKSNAAANSSMPGAPPPTPPNIPPPATGFHYEETPFGRFTVKDTPQK